MSDMMIFSGNANPRLAKSVAAHLNVSLGKATLGRFSDGEIMIEILENVRGKDVFIIQSTSAPTNDHLMELLNDTHLAIIDKRRPQPNEARVMNIIGEVENALDLIGM